MYNQYGCFLPIKNFGYNQIKIDNKPKITSQNNFFCKNSPFFSIMNDNSTSELFLEALKKMSTEDAKAFISKEIQDYIDWQELKNYFSTVTNHKFLIKVDYQKISRKNYLTNSILIFNKQSEISTIVHLHLVNEPDNFSKWKICGFSQE